MTCLWNGANAPRVIKGRHDEDCADRETCRGCQSCTEAHCRCCGHRHADQTCAECSGQAREDLATIGLLTRKLTGEAIDKGVRSEAFALMSPAADPEAWGHMTTSLHVGRLPVGYLVCDRCDAPWPCAKHADGELHPDFVCGTWEFVWRDALDHETDAPFDLAESIRYLDQQLTYMSTFEDAPFEDFAADLRRCRAHLEAVLHDQNHGDRANVGCFGTPEKGACGGALERKLAADGFEDVWTCRRCRQTYTQAEYNFALRAKLEDEAS